MQSVKDGPFYFLLTYKDDGTKFSDNAALTSTRASAVAHASLDIWSVTGPPAILGCDNGKEFSGLGKNVKNVSESSRAIRREVHTMCYLLPRALLVVILHTELGSTPHTHPTSVHGGSHH